MSNPFQFLPISQMAAKFPDNTWWAKFYKDFDDEHLVAYCEGDLTLSHLDLDWYIAFPEQKGVTIIFINGHFTVGNLYNSETDGAVSLIVMGNMQASNIAVGGQEIFVLGNLQVEEIVCGSYNHGEMIVEGNLQTNVIIRDDEYRFNVAGEQKVACAVNVWDTLAVCEEIPVDIREVLVDDVFLDDEDEDDEVNFSFAMLVSVLMKGRSAVLNWNDTLQRKKNVPITFTQNMIDEANILKLTECVLMQEENTYFEFEEDTVYFKVQREYIGTDGDKRNASIYIETSQFDYFIYLNDDRTISLLMKNEAKQVEWEEITAEFPEQLTELTECWLMLLTCVNVAELYLPNIKLEEVQYILQHPVIQQLDPYGEDNDGYWDGSKYYGFRRDSYIDEDGYCFAARVHIETSDGAFYFYTLDNNKYVSRHYQSPNSTARQEISLLDTKRFEASDRYFTRFKQFIAQKIGDKR